MRDILPRKHSLDEDMLPRRHSHESSRYLPDERTWRRKHREEDWKREGREDMPQIRIGHCFSQRPRMKQTMIDLDSTSIGSQRHPPPMDKEMYSKVSERAESSPPPRVIIFQNESDMSDDTSAEERYLKFSQSPPEGRFPQEERFPDSQSDDDDDNEQFGDEIRTGDQVIVKVDPKTPPPVPSPSVDRDKEMVWDDTEVEAPSPASVIIKVEPRTPSPIEEDAPDSPKDGSLDRPEFITGE